MRSMLELLAYLRAQGVTIALNGTSLKINAPKGVVTAELRDELTQHKPEIIDFLQTSREASRDSNWSIQILDRSKDLPLSFSQQRLWFLQQLDLSSSTYNIPVAMELKGVLDEAALEESIAAIVQRHEALRTVFVQKDGEPSLSIQPDANWHLEKMRLPGVSSEEIGERIKELLRKPFDLNKGPLFRICLMETNRETYVLTLSMHHIISDGWSMGVIVSELAENYKNLLEKKRLHPTTLPIQYADFAAWQRTWLESGELSRQLPYWQRTLEGAPPVVQFPPDFARPAIEESHGRRSLMVLPSSVLRDVENVSRRENVTLFMLLLSVFKVLLFRYSGQHDVVVGTPSANRSRAELSPLIGFFVNNLVLRTNLEGDPTFRELLHKVRYVTLQAYDHQDVPFDKLVQALRPERTLGHSPIFQTMFSFQNFPFEELELPGLKASLMQIDIGTSRYDLTLELVPRLGELHAYFEYNTDLYSAETIADIQKHFAALLRQVLADTALPISEYRLLTAEEEKTVVEDFTGPTRQIAHAPFHRVFEERARQFPDNTAITAAASSMTYRELNTRANQIANFLIQNGVTKGDRVGVYVERSPDLIAALIAVMKAGAAYVPLDPVYPRQRIAMILEDAKPRVAITSKSMQSFFEDLNIDLAVLESIDRSFVEDTFRPKVSLFDLAYVIFTSGSTGRPKGVQITHGSLMNFLESMAERPGFTSSDMLLAVTTVSFDIAALELFLPLFCGGQLYMAEQTANAEALLSDFRRVQPTVMQATPATWQLLLSMGWEGSKNLRILCGGEALEAELAKSLLTCSQSLWNMYGPTETTIWSGALRVTGAHTQTVPIGGPVQNTTLMILDSKKKPVPFGVAGELYIGGAGLAEGYLNRSDLTAEKFVTSLSVERLYRTGDLAKYKRDRTLEFLGRIDHQVKLRGFRIELGEIEQALRSLSGIEDAVVVLRGDHGDKRLVAYVIAEESEQLSAQALRNAMRNSLPEYMLPTAFVFLGEFPRTPNGKLDRSALPEPGQPKSANPSGLPQNPTQAAIVSVFQEMLQVQNVSVNDNFFELGAHSLLIVKVHEKLQKRLDSELSLIHFFQYPTIAALADFVEKKDKATLAAASGALS